MSYNSRRAVPFFICAALLVAGARCVKAEFVPRVSYSSDGGDGVVTINDRIAVRFRVPNGRMSPYERAQVTAGRIAPLAGGGWKGVTTKPLGKRRAHVVAGGNPICLATKADAKAAGLSARGLAATWASRIRSLLAMPPITLSPRRITVPLGESRAIAVGGAATGKLWPADTDPKMTATTANSEQRTAMVQGRALGQSTIEVTCEGYKASVIVDVKKYAGRVFRPEIAEVTGNPAPSRVLQDAANTTAPTTVALEPGASASYGKPEISVETLAGGSRTMAHIPVKVEGPGMIPAQLTSSVEIVNRPIPRQPARGLFYSNDPEKVTRYGTLFTGRLTPDQRQRLFYHHLNMSGHPMRLRIELMNAGDTTAQVHTVSGTAPPRPDPVLGGYLAGVSFARDYIGDIGYIRRILSRTRFVVYAEDLPAGRTASGIIDMRLLAGDNVYLRISSDAPSSGAGQGSTPVLNDASVPTVLSDHVYADPTISLDATYVVGGRWQFIRLGKQGLSNHVPGRQLDGNYGVFYQIHIRIENPTAAARKVHVVFEPTAGPASGVFIISGQVIGIRTVNPPGEEEITSVTVGPGQVKELTVMTMPLGGSAYPATILVKP